MSKIDEMKKELCPEGVERVQLGSVCSSIFAGGTPSTSRDDFYDGNIPWIRSGEIDFNRILKAERNITDIGLANSSAKMIEPCSVVMAMTGATVGKVATVEIETSANQSVCALEMNKDNLDYRYLYYYLSAHYHDIKSSAQGALTSLNLQMIKALQIPLPPLSIQQEIVSVLDSFTTLIDKMKQEVEKRKKQMGYYRERLLTFEDGECEWKSIGALGYSFNGLTGKSKKDFENGNSVFVTYSNIFNNPELNMNIPERVMICEGERQNVIAKGDILFTSSSETQDEAGMSSVVLEEPNEDMYLNSFCFGLRLYDLDSTKPSYLKYLLRSKNIRDSISKTAFGVTRFNINKDKFFKVLIPIPAQNHQYEIASTLDKFESYISKLEKMIELRQKQYEYYREQLLTFE